jgi:nucleoside-diphosphate-sugar epimerase
LIILQKSSGVFIPADEENLSTVELCKLIAAGLRKQLKVVKIPNVLLRLIEFIKPDFYSKLFGSFALDNKQTRNKLGIDNLFSSKQGIHEMTTWFKKQVK